MVDINPVPTNLDGLQLEEPFLKLDVGNPGARIIVNKDNDEYTVEARDPEDGQVIYPKTKKNGEFWQSQRKTSSLVKDFKLAGVIDEDVDKDEFRLEIAKHLNEQYELWTDKRMNANPKPKKSQLDQNYDRGVREEAKKLLRTGDILKEVKTVMDFMVAGEDKTKLGLFLQLLTKDFEEPLMIYGIQKQGEGKSFVAKQVLKLFPDHMVEELTDATKSAIYRIAETEGPDYFDNKIVFFGEIPENEEDRDVFQIFRELCSEGKVSKRLNLESDEGGYESRKLELEGAPVMISTTIDPDRIDDQDLSRGVTYSPSMSDDQYKKVREYQNRLEELPEEALIPDQIKNKKEVIQCAIEILSDRDIKVKNPFTRCIDQLIPEHTDNIKRDYPKVLRIVGRVPTYLYHRQRPSIVAGEQKYYLTTYQDIIRGLIINKGFINGMIEGRVQSTLDAYEVIKKNVESVGYSYEGCRSKLEEKGKVPGGEPFTNQDLQQWMGIGYKTAMNYTRRLDRMKLIYKDSGTRPNEHYLLNKNVESDGITPRSLLKITASVLDQEAYRDWFRELTNFFDIECKRDSLFDKLTDDVLADLELEPVEGEKLSYRVNKDVEGGNYPICYDLATTLRPLYGGNSGSSEEEEDSIPPLPLYMKNSGNSTELAKDFRVGIEDANIFIELRGVSEDVLAKESMEWEPLKDDDSDDSDGSAPDSDSDESVQDQGTTSSDSNKRKYAGESNNQDQDRSRNDPNNKKQYIKRLVQQASESTDDQGVDEQYIIDCSQLDEETADRMLKQLKDTGVLYEPRPGRVEVM